MKTERKTMHVESNNVMRDLWVFKKRLKMSRLNLFYFNKGFVLIKLRPRILLLF